MNNEVLRSLPPVIEKAKIVPEGINETMPSSIAVASLPAIQPALPDISPRLFTPFMIPPAEPPIKIFDVVTIPLPHEILSPELPTPGIISPTQVAGSIDAISHIMEGHTQTLTDPVPRFVNEINELGVNTDEEFNNKRSNEQVYEFLFRNGPPLKDIASPVEREVKKDDELLTEYHEIFHGLVSIHKQAPVGLSVIKTVIDGEEAAGHASIYGEVTHEDLKVIAAAGAINPPGGLEARGFDGDMQKIDILFQERGGMTKEEAYQEAVNIVKNYHPLVLKRAAQILAHEKELRPDQVGLLMKHALYELWEEKVDLTEVEISWIINNTIKWGDSDWKGRNHTIIDNLDNEDINVRFVLVEIDNKDPLTDNPIADLLHKERVIFSEKR